ncbi:MAG: hypothetical protein H6620_06070 [Halobacteriovoraceae bacterium]|nr:hypothetical protein [Halobacteriovoraceae bacterium]
MWSFNYQLLFNFLFAGLALYIIIRHFFFDTNKGRTKSDDTLERMIREKETLLGKTPVSDTRASVASISLKQNKFFKQLDKSRQWDANKWQEIVQGELRKLFFLDLPSVGDSLDYTHLRDLSGESKELFIKNYFIEWLREKIQKRSVEYIDKLKVEEFFFASLFSVGMHAEVFQQFTGDIHSLRNLCQREHYCDLIREKMDKTWKGQIENIFKDIKSLILLEKNKVSELFEHSKDVKKTFKELSQIYHPDKINLKMIPKAKREHFEKLYSEQYALINSTYSSQSR